MIFRKALLFISLLTFSTLLLYGCGTYGNTQTTPVASADETTLASSDEATVESAESSASDICGWWKLEIDNSLAPLIDGLIIFIGSDGTGAMYCEYPSGNYYTNLQITNAEGNEYTLTGDTGVSNIFTLTTDTSGNQFLLNSDFTQVNNQFVTVTFSKTDESIIEGKDYIYISEEGNY